MRESRRGGSEGERGVVEGGVEVGMGEGIWGRGFGGVEGGVKGGGGGGTEKRMWGIKRMRGWRGRGVERV